MATGAESARLSGGHPLARAYYPNGVRCLTSQRHQKQPFRVRKLRKPGPRTALTRAGTHLEAHDYQRAAGLVAHENT
jgi:hypothetical protein